MAEIVTSEDLRNQHSVETQLGALAATLTVVVGRIDALEERIAVVRELVDMALNVPAAPMPFPFVPPPMPGVQYPPLPGGGGIEVWRLQQRNLDLTKKLQTIVKILISDDPSLKEDGHAPRPWTRSPESP